MRDKDLILLEKAYCTILESRAAGTEAQEAGESARVLAMEKALIKSITEDLLATAAHLNSMKPLLGVFDQGDQTPDFQALSTAFQEAQTALQGLAARMPALDDLDGGAPADQPPIESEPVDMEPEM
jgi:hypothetical protein